jgi:acylphosphatase
VKTFARDEGVEPSSPWSTLDSGRQRFSFFKLALSRQNFYSQIQLRSFHMAGILRAIAAVIALSLAWAALAVAPASAESSVAAANVTAVSGVVTGNVQKVGFRAMIQKQAIRYNLAGSARNDSDGSVRFVLQGLKDRVDEALDTIREGTKNSSNVKVSVSPATITPDAKTFTVFGWTSVSRAISHPYDLVFDLRPDNTILKKHEAKAVWLEICEKTVQGEDIGKCDKDDDH